MKIVIVGYGPGGAAAAVAARMFSSESDIKILTDETLEAHKKPGASLALEFPDTEKLSINDWSVAALAEKRIEVLSGTRVEAGDPVTKTLQIVNGNGASVLKFDRLILATGGIPNVPNIPGIALQGVFTIQTLADTRAIGKQLSGMSTIVIIGAGFSGLETAERMINLGKETHMVVRSRLMRRQLEPPMSAELRSRLPRSFKLHLGSSPTEIVGDQHVVGVSIGDEIIDADAVLFMTGVKPNTTLAQSLGVRIGDLGGIIVNEQMQTSEHDIFAVGDCIEMKDTYTGKNILLPIGSMAARCGRQAGVAAVGGKKIYADTSKRLQYDRLFGIDVVCIGHSSTTANDLGVKTVVQYVEDPIEFSKTALVLDSNGRLIGGQVIASRQGARLGYEILERVESGVILKDQPLLKPRHERLLEYLENSFGPIQ
ncbi:MAG: FAD-dependent oxidoreductase [Candidatus Thorarchaeota archaeon]|nr:FAD-dependent oxidoreductase [Candidatus Thorarchaeota archaeon]